MVEAAATMAMETLRDLLIDEVKFLSAVEGHVVDVGRDLQKMHRFLKDADKWQDRNNSAVVQGWVSDLIDLSTSAEDVLERYVVQVTSKREAKNLKEMFKRFTCILGECSTLHEIGEEAERIMPRMAQLNKDLESIRNGEGSSSFESNDDQRLLRQTYGHGIEEHFVGMKNDIDLLVSRMKNDDRSFRLNGGIIRIGGLRELETLIGFSSKVFDTNDVLKLTNLRSFGGSVYDIESLSVVVDHITELKEQLREAHLRIVVNALPTQVVDSLMCCPVLNNLEIKG